MRVLVWHPVYVLGGGFEVLRRVCPALAAQAGIESVTVAVNREYPAAMLAPLAEAGLALRRIDVGEPLARHADGHDVAWVPWPHGTPQTPAAIPKVCVFQDTILLDAYGGHTTGDFIESMERAVRETVDYYDHTILTSRYTRSRMLELSGPTFADRLHVLPHMASPVEPLPAVDRVESTGRQSPPRQKLDLPGDYFVYPANVSEHKNHITLLAAVSKRRRREPPIVFYGHRTELIGSNDLVEDPYVNRINRLIVQRGLTPGRDFLSLGYVDDATATGLLRGAAAVVMPTRAEGMGLPIHEAIDARVPVVCSDIEVLREHYADRSRAILWVDPECPTEIAMALDEVLDHAADWRVRAAANRGCGSSWDDVAAATKAVLSAALCRRRRYFKSGIFGGRLSAFGRRLASWMPLGAGRS